MPFDSDYVCYVWFDALINYISAIGYTYDNEHFHSWWPVNYHLIGKDILITHTVYWTTMLKAIGIDQPKTIFAHGWWLIDGGKISKSKANAVDPLNLIDKYGIDAFRFFLLATMAAGQDTTFSEERFARCYECDLVNNFGNLAHRISKLIETTCKSFIPDSAVEKDIDQELQNEIVRIAEEVENLVVALKIDIIISNVIKGFSIINQYLEKTKPWKLNKKPSDKSRLKSILGNAVEALRILSGILYPIIPGKIVKLRHCLGCIDADRAPSYQELKEWGNSLGRKRVEVTDFLFPRI